MSEVEITLNGKTEVLKPTLDVAKKLAAMGGLIPVLRKLDDYDINTYSAIVAAALGKTVKDVENSVFSAGMATLNAPLGNFVGMHFTGGKSSTEDETAPGEE